MPGLASDDLGESLRALRDVLIAQLEIAKPGETAALAKQLADVLERIDRLPKAERSSLDDLAGRRSARRSKVQKRSSGGVVRGSGGR